MLEFKDSTFAEINQLPIVITKIYVGSYVLQALLYLMCKTLEFLYLIRHFLLIHAAQEILFLNADLISQNGQKK